MVVHRTAPLGEDRDFNRYYWVNADRSALYVEEVHGRWIACFSYA
jgi:hypothetical protein